MKKRIKRFEAALLSMVILFLTFSGDMVMAADTETQKTTCLRSMSFTKRVMIKKILSL